MCHFNSTERIQSCNHGAYRTHCHLCPSRYYSFSPESSEAFKGEVPSTRTQHRNNVPRLRGKKHYISPKILRQAGFETARQAATLSKRQALVTFSQYCFILYCKQYRYFLVLAFSIVIAPCPSHKHSTFNLIQW